MGLLSALNLPTPKALADAKAGKEREAPGASAAKTGLWDQAKDKVAQGRKSIEGLTKAYTEAKKELLEPLENAKKVADADYGNETPTQSAVDPGAAEQSLKDFADQVEAATKRLKQAQGLLQRRRSLHVLQVAGAVEDHGHFGRRHRRERPLDGAAVAARRFDHILFTCIDGMRGADRQRHREPRR
jgi:hypothetical protein